MAGAAARLYIDIGANVSGAIAGMKATDAQLKKTAATARATSSTMKASSVGYTMVGTSASRASKQVSGAAPAMQKSAAATKGMAKQSQALRGTMQGLGVGMTATQGTVLALAYGVGKSIAMTSKFDGAMRNVNSIAGLSEASFQKLSASVRGLAGPTAQAPQTLAEGMYQLVSSGFSASESLKIIKSSAIAASAGLTDTETATTAVAGVLNAYHLKAKDAAQVSDDLFQTVNLGVLSFQDLAQGIGPVLPFASRLGISLKQVGAMTSTLTKAGVPAAEAFTYQKGAMAQLLKPTESLNREYKKLGVSSGRELVSKTGSFQAALESLFKSVGSNDKKFAKLFPDIRGLSAAFTATGSGAKGAAADLRGFNNTAGATSRVFAEQKKSTAFKFKQLKVDAANAATTLGTVLKPAVDGTISVLDQMAIGVDHAAKGWSDFGTAVKNGMNALNDVKGKGARESQLDNYTPKYKKPVVRSGNMADVKRLIQKNPFKVDVETKLKMGVDITNVKSGASKAQEFLSNVRSSHPKIDVSSNAPSVSRKAVAAISAVTGKRVYIDVVTRKSGGNADTVVNGGRLPGRAMGGKSPLGNVAMVGEQGPELVELPNGAYVNTAAKTRSLLAAGVPGYAGGGKVSAKTRKRRAKLRDRADRYGQNKLDTLDFQESTGSISTAKSIATLESLLKSKKFKKASASAKRSAKSKLYDLKTTQRSSIKDLEDQAAAVGADPITAAQIAQRTASRHLAEARKTKNAEKIAQAQLEVAEANNELLEAQKAAQEAQMEAIRAHTEAVKANTEEIKRQNNMAESNKGITKNTLRSALADLTNDDLGGIFGQRFQTGSRRTSAYVSR